MRRATVRHLDLRVAGGIPSPFHRSGRRSSGVGWPVGFLMLFTRGAARDGYFEGASHLAGMSEEERIVHHDSYFTDMTNGPAAQSWHAGSTR